MHRDRPHRSIRRNDRLTFMIVTVVSIATIAAACSADEAADTSDTAPIEVDGDTVELPEGIEPFRVSELDLDTLEGEIPDGTLAAQPWEDTWVGEVTDDLFIGLRVDDENEPTEVVAYLCDNDVSILLDGPLEDGAATLTGQNTEVTLEVDDDVIIGEVSLDGGDAEAFTAEPATGDAGVYAAQHDLDEVDVTARWIVLPDERQRGNSICCVTHPNGQQACFPCWQMQ